MVQFLHQTIFQVATSLFCLSDLMGSRNNKLNHSYVRSHPRPLSYLEIEHNYAKQTSKPFLGVTSVDRKQISVRSGTTNYNKGPFLQLNWLANYTLHLIMPMQNHYQHYCIITQKVLNLKI